MSFTHPAWLLGALLICITLAWSWRRYDERQRRALARFVAPQLRQRLTQSVSTGRRTAQRAAFLTAVMCLCAALAGPLFGFRWEQVNRRGNEIVFALDTSRSMLTPDVKPNRLNRAKLVIDDLARQLDGNALGIVAFAGVSYLVCPITLDIAAFHESLNAIDTDTIPRGGTNMSSAIQESEAALQRRPGGDKILILITDGEDLEGNALTAAQAAAKRSGLRIFTIGVGTAAGDLIPTADPGGFVKDETGTPVKSRLDEAALKAIAGAAGGLYIPLGVHGDAQEAVLTGALDLIAKHDLASRQQRIYNQRFQWPLAASLGFLLLSLLIGSRRRVRRPAALRQSAIAVVFLVTLGSLSRAPRAADTKPSQQPVEDYNSGTAAYRAGRFPQATQAFQQSIRRSPSSDARRLADQQDAYYNLGNTLYRVGQKSEQSSPQEALKHWNEALTAYDTALQLRPDDADSKYNRDFVKRKIDELSQKPPPSGGGGGGGGGGSGSGSGGGSGSGSGGGSGSGSGSGGSSGSGGNGSGRGQPPPEQAGQYPPQPQNGASPPQQPPPPQDGTAPPQQPQPQPQNGAAPPQQSGDLAPAEDQRVAGQMNREEARELLDSAKGDERQTLKAPAMRNAEPPPDKPFKNW